MKQEDKMQTFTQVSIENKGRYDDIVMNKKSLFYDNINNILRIQHYIKREVFQEKVSKINSRHMISS